MHKQWETIFVLCAIIENDHVNYVHVKLIPIETKGIYVLYCNSKFPLFFGLS